MQVEAGGNGHAAADGAGDRAAVGVEAEHPLDGGPLGLVGGQLGQLGNEDLALLAQAGMPNGFKTSIGFVDSVTEILQTLATTKKPGDEPSS